MGINKRIICFILLLLLFICASVYVYLKINLYNYKSLKINYDDVVTSSSNFLVISSEDGNIRFYNKDFKAIKTIDCKDVKNMCCEDNLLLILKKDGTVWKYDVDKDVSPSLIPSIENAETISFGGVYLIYSDKANTYLMQIRNHTHPDCLNSNLTLYKSYQIKNIENMKVVSNSYALALIDNKCNLYITDKAKIIEENGDLNLKQYLSEDKIEFCYLSNNFSFVVNKDGMYYLTPYSDMSEKKDKTKVGKVKQFAFCENRYILNSKGKLFEWGMHKSAISGNENISLLPERVCRFETFDAIYPTKDILFAKKENKIYKLKR